MIRTLFSIGWVLLFFGCHIDAQITARRPRQRKNRFRASLTHEARALRHGEKLLACPRCRHERTGSPPAREGVALGRSEQPAE